jgi:glycosyltransferase involved in cell wall biosynthesis
MSSQPLVSVITIFLNAEKFFSEAIESVFAQTYQHWELLLVDDGSTDGSTRIALNYAAQYPDKVRYLEHAGHQNRGMSASRNLGVMHAQGQYIAFLDADDVWLSQKLAQQVAILDTETRAAMLYGRTQIWYSWTGRPEDIQRDYMPNLGVKPDTLVEPPALFLLLISAGVQTPTTCNVLLRREVIDIVGGFEEDFHGLYEDQAFFVKVCLKMPVFVANTWWAKYRQHPDSCYALATKTGEDDKRWGPFLNWIAAYLTEQKIKDPIVWEVLEQQLRLHHPSTLDRFIGRGWQLFGILSESVKRILPKWLHGWLQRLYRTIVKDTLIAQ